MVNRLDITARLQRRIVEISSTAIPLIAKRQDEADLVGLNHLRGELMAAVGAYVRHIHRLGIEVKEPSAEIELLASRCLALRVAYRDFRRRWIYRDGMDHWHEYRLSASVLMKQIRALTEPRNSAINFLPSAAR